MSDVSYDPLRYAQAGEQRIDRAFTGIANRRAGQALQRGDYGAASGALFGNGDLQGGAAIQDRQTQQQTAQRTEEAAKAAREAELTLRVTGALREVQARNGDVVAAFDAMTPQLTQFGIAPELQAQLRTFISSDESALDQLERLAGQKAAEWTFRDGGGGDVAAVRQTPTGGIESRLAYNAPDRPIVTPSGILLPPSQTGANDMGGAMPPVTGAAIQPNAPTAGLVSSMVPITAQAESGNRDVDANGNVITSSANARGRMQVLDGTNTDPGFGVTPARDGSLEERARVGRDYLAAMMRRYGNDPAKAWAAYNWGPGNLDAAIARDGGNWLQGAPRETQNYVSQNLAALNGGGGVTAQQPPASQAMDVGGGWSLTPMQSPADRRAEQQLELSRNADRRAQDAANRAAAPVRTLSASEVEAMGLPSGSVVQQRPDGTINIVSGRAERYTEGQRNAAYFAYRLQGASRAFDALRQRGIVRPSPAILAFGEGRLRENALSASDRQWLQASRNWLAPILRKDTGAAITAPEVVFYMGEYLPSPTDDDATIAQKLTAQRRAEDALMGLAGGAYAELYPQESRPSGRRGPQTNAPGLPFNITPQQLQFRQQLVQGGRANVQSPRGSETNPIYVNPADETTSYGNIRPGAWFVAPSGEVLQKPPSNNRRRR
jgi:hypothetical protein